MAPVTLAFVERSFAALGFDAVVRSLPSHLLCPDLLASLLRNLLADSLGFFLADFLFNWLTIPLVSGYCDRNFHLLANFFRPIFAFFVRDI